MSDHRRGVTCPPVPIGHVFRRVSKPRSRDERHVQDKKDESNCQNLHYNYTLKILRTALAVTPPFSAGS